MVTTRGQKSAAGPVVAAPAKLKFKKNAHKDAPTLQGKLGGPIDGPNVRGQKRPLPSPSSKAIGTLRPRRSKRHAASPAFDDKVDDPNTIGLLANESPAPELLQNNSPSVESVRSGQPVPETTLNDFSVPRNPAQDSSIKHAVVNDLPVSEGPAQDLGITQTPPEEPSTLEASLSDHWSFSESDDNEHAIHSPFLFDSHIPRPTIHTPTLSPDPDGPEEAFSSQSSHRQVPKPTDQVPEDNDALERNAILWNDIQHQNALIERPSHGLKLAGLPQLEHWANTVIYIIAKANPVEIMSITKNPSSEQANDPLNAGTKFRNIRKVYSHSDVFLNPWKLEPLSPEQQAIIQRANLATYMLSLFGSQDFGFLHLNEYFLRTFSMDGKLQTTKQDLYLALKTQAFISAMTAIMAGEDRKEAILDELFPSDLDKQLLASRRTVKLLTVRDKDFIDRCRRRRAHLLKTAPTDQGIGFLQKQFPWGKFVLKFSLFLEKNFESLTGETLEMRAQRFHRDQALDLELKTVPSKDENSHASVIKVEENTSARPISDEDEIAEKAARAADLVMQDYGNHTTGASTQQPYHQIHFQPPLQQNGYYIFDNASQVVNPQQSTHSEQTEASLQAQYNQARLTANSKPSPTARRPGTPSSRRPWSEGEESALMEGLDTVGPHWSQILALYGADGTISKVLKDRNQVQLKDKARNLKLYFLKQNKPVPESLQNVTGELKTRAPSVASRQNHGQLSVAQPERSIRSFNQALNQTASHGIPHSVASPANASPANTNAAGAGPDMDLETALAAAERAGLESP